MTSVDQKKALVDTDQPSTKDQPIRQKAPVLASLPQEHWPLRVVAIINSSVYYLILKGAWTRADVYVRGFTV